MWFVYILLCSDESYYVGSTSDIERRLTEHQNQKGSHYLRSRLPVKLCYQESLETRDSALKRERQIKGWSRAKKTALIAGDYFRLIRLSKSKD
ncbi:MAG: GIY-YIG nuclease family protein [Candidatus Omnitrophica bacterium]|nr:GIY-YIG nuclease family protein [Candidatus Omnitrophota bacterium]MDD5671442.1 GIY-YIG nuclease family protein [Candidatus Omnitrophota bacterium]